MCVKPKQMKVLLDFIIRNNRLVKLQLSPKNSRFVMFGFFSFWLTNNVIVRFP